MWIVALCLAAACGGRGSAQPLASCFGQEECDENYYCDSTTKTCSEYLSCADVNKEPPSNLAKSAFVKSFVDCGPCLKGFVVDSQGDINAGCVSPDSQQSPTLPLYLWVLIALGIFFVIVLVIGLYLYRKQETFKIWASTSIRSLFDRPSGSQSAQDPPPPYSYYMSNLNPPNAPPEECPDHLNEELTQPFIKQAPSSQPQDAREAEDKQTAVVFNRPTYNNQDDESVSSPEPTEDRHDKYSHAIPWLPQDEDTVPSVWTPHEEDEDESNSNVNPPGSGVNSGASGAGAGAGVGVGVGVGAAAEGATSLQVALRSADVALGPSAPKRTRTTARQDSNNNSNSDSSAGPSASGSDVNPQQSTSDVPTSYTIYNVVINHNTK